MKIPQRDNKCSSQYLLFVSSRYGISQIRFIRLGDDPEQIKFSRFLGKGFLGFWNEHDKKGIVSCCYFKWNQLKYIVVVVVVEEEGNLYQVQCSRRTQQTVG